MTSWAMYSAVHNMYSKISGADGTKKQSRGTLVKRSLRLKHVVSESRHRDLEHAHTLKQQTAYQGDSPGEAGWNKTRSV